MDITQPTTPHATPTPHPEGSRASGRRPQAHDGRRAPARRLAGGLGWFSIGLGLAQILGPGEVARMVGLPSDRRTRSTMTAIGVREIASGLGLLAANRRRRWMWLRVGGDLVDLALLGSTITTRTIARRRESGRLLVGITAVGALTMLDALAARRLGREPRPARSTAAAMIPRARRTVTATTTIRRPVEEVYRFWRALENLPCFMAHIESIEVMDERRSHWIVRGPAGISVEWDAEIIEDRPGESITWRSRPGASIDNRGTVRFVPAPGDRGTEVHATITYGAPGGRVGAMIAKLFGREPGQQAQGDLRRFKQVLETGEVVHSDASIHGRPHPAQPPTRRFLSEHGIEPGRGRPREQPNLPPQPPGYGGAATGYGTQGGVTR